MKCIFCGEEREPSKEHIIPEAMGNSKFITNRVCQKCNSDLGRNIDNYLTNHFFTKCKRKELDLLGKKEKPINVFPSKMRDTNGNEYLFRDDKPIRIPKIKQNEHRISIEANTEIEGLDMATKFLKRQGLGMDEIKNIMDNGRIEKKIEMPPQFNIPIDIDLDRYLLSGIKIAYEFTFKTLEDIYLNDATAIILRDMLYRVSKFSKEQELTADDISIIRNHAKIEDKTTLKMKNYIREMMRQCNMDVQHMCIIAPDADNNLIVHISLFCEDIYSFTVKVSEEAEQYKMRDKIKILLLLTNGDVINL